jgi:electron transfer flavoprotein alpha subunit
LRGCVKKKKFSDLTVEMKKIGILVELKDGALKPVNAGVITAAHGVDHELYALIFSRNGAAFKEELQAWGINKIVAIDASGASLAWNPAVWAKAIMQAMAKFDLNMLLGLASAQGKDLLPRVAAYLDAPLVMDCVQVNLTELTAVKSQFSGKTLATIRVGGAHCIFGLRPNAVEPQKAECRAELLRFEPVVDQEPLVVRAVKRDAVRKIDLSEADMIISGGRAMGGTENFRVLDECAQVLGAAVGASRVAVDAGWVPHSMQVGQTGTTVSPKLYVACGISGSIQHFAGMKTAKVIVAINTDPNAPMVKNCDYAIIGDLFEIVPLMSRRLEEIFAKQPL